MYPAIACDAQPDLVFDCQRFGQLVVMVWNPDMTYFGRQDPGDAECILEQGSCMIPVSDNTGHQADLEQCEDQGYCTVNYIQHTDGTCSNGVTNYEQVIYECKDPSKL